MTKSYQISKDMDIEMMPHAMYFTGNLDTVTKINHVPYQTICTYNRVPILPMYPRTESNIPIHTGGGLIKSHFWLEILLQLEHQTIQIKVLVCDSECPYDLILGCTSMAQLSAWQDSHHTSYTSNRSRSH